MRTILFLVLLPLTSWCDSISISAPNGHMYTYLRMDQRGIYLGFQGSPLLINMNGAPACWEECTMEIDTGDGSISALGWEGVVENSTLLFKDNTYQLLADVQFTIDEQLYLGTYIAWFGLQDGLPQDDSLVSVDWLSQELNASTRMVHSPEPSTIVFACTTALLFIFLRRKTCLRRMNTRS